MGGLKMKDRENIINKLERGRAEFAYRCAKEGKEIISGKEINGDYYKDDKYKSYVKRISTMILTNGLGQTLAYIFSKKQKEKNKKKPGTRDNPKNAYDLIYKHLSEYLKSECVTGIKMPEEEKDLLKWVVNIDSLKYRYLTDEVLAFMNWLKRIAEGLIEEEEEQ